MRILPDQFGWPPLMPMRVATAFCSTSRWTLQRAVNAGELVPVGKRGRSLVFSRTSLEAFMLGDGAEPVALPHARTITRSGSGSEAALARLRVIKGGR